MNIYVVCNVDNSCRGEEAVKASLSIYSYMTPAINLSAQVLLCRYIYFLNTYCPMHFVGDLIYSTTPVATLI